MLDSHFAPQFIAGATLAGVTGVTTSAGRRGKPYSEVRYRPIAIKAAPTLSFTGSLGGAPPRTVDGV
jgi:hypothetical protein